MKTIIRSAVITHIKAADRSFRVTITTDQPDRDGDVLEPKGLDLAEYLSNPVVLFQHDGNAPVAKSSDLTVLDDRIDATVQFPTAGISAKSDEVFGLVKEGVINTASIGFLPDVERMKARGNGWYIPAAKLLEFSLVSVPANAGALIHRSIDMQKIRRRVALTR